MMEDTKELIKDKECLYCKKFFECKGKASKSPCVNFEEDKDGRG